MTDRMSCAAPVGVSHPRQPPPDRVSQSRENRAGFLTRLRLRPTRHVLESKKEAPVDRGLLEQPRV